MSTTLENGSQFGQTVAIDGDRVAVGAIYENHANNYAGSVYVFERDTGGPDSWGQVVEFIAADTVAPSTWMSRRSARGPVTPQPEVTNERASAQGLGVHVIGRCRKLARGLRRIMLK